MPQHTIEISGEELYRRYLEGDTEAFQELVALYEQELSSFLYSMVRDYYEAKHLTIETFAELAISGGKFEGKSTLKTYLFAIAKRLAAHLLKKRGAENHLSLEDVLEVVAGEAVSPDAYLEREENRLLLRAVMQTLKAEYREVLYLLYFEDMSYQEAGQVMRKSVKQISDLAYRAKASLKKKLQSEGFTNV